MVIEINSIKQNKIKASGQDVKVVRIFKYFGLIMQQRQIQIRNNLKSSTNNVSYCKNKNHLERCEYLTKDQNVACIGLLDFSICRGILDIKSRITAKNLSIRNEM